MDMLLVLERQPVLGQLLVAFNHMTRHYKAWQVAFGTLFAHLVYRKIQTILNSELPLLAQLKKFVFSILRKVPFVQGKIEGEVEKTRQSFVKSMVKAPEGWSANRALPATGFSPDEVTKKMQTMLEFEKSDVRHKAGKVSGTIYVGGDDLKEYTEMLTKVYGMFAWTNPLHPGVFPGIRQMEAEIVSMCLGLFHGGPDGCGVMTSGGTESIIMALKAYREWGAQTKGITSPNIVLPRTAHPAFDKGCEYFGIQCRKIDEDPQTRAADVAAMIRAADSNTVAFVGSAPQYPHGCVDPIPELAVAARQRGCGLHVDCCLGSFLVPFMKECGFEFPEFDFALPGVTTISCDTHKYGFSPKGSSILMYADTKLRRYQYSVFADWPGGIYGTPGMAGSRPGALVAATWAALTHHGADGYRDNTRKIVETSKYIAEGIKKIPGLKLVCEPDVSVVAWTSDVFDINRQVTGIVDEKGWDLNVLQFPAAIHIGVTMAHVSDGHAIADNFLADLAEVTAPLVASPHIKAEGAAAMYGMAQSIPDRTVIQDITAAYLDTMYQSA